MLNARHNRRIAAYVLAFLIVPGASWAQSISVTINGQVIPCPSGSCLSSFTLTGVEVAGWVIQDANGTAKVKVGGDATLPALVLEYARFKATADAVTADVAFWQTFTAGQNVPPSLQMKRVAEGHLVRVEGSTSAWSNPTNRGSFTVDGVVTSAQYPSGESIDNCAVPQILGGNTGGSQKIVTSSLWYAGKIDPVPFAKCENFDLLNGERTLKGEFTVYLPKKDDSLRVKEIRIETLQPAKKGEGGSNDGYTDIVEDGEDDEDADRRNCHRSCCPMKKCRKK